MDHVIGVLHYKACDSSGKPYGNEVVHSHFDRNKVIFRYDWMHKRGGYMCNNISNAISQAAVECVSDVSKYVSVLALHGAENCACARGKEFK